MLVEESVAEKKADVNMTHGATTQQTTNSEDDDSERKKMQMRREARRKKILENSKDRMAKLGVREAPIANGTVAYEDVSDPEVEPNIPNLLRTDFSHDIPLAQAESFRFTRNTETFGNMDFNALFTGMSGETITTNTNAVPARKENLWQRTRLHVILIAFITFLTTVYHVAAGWSVFTLLGVSLISELLFFTREREVGPLVNLAILLCGVQPQLARRLMHLLLILYNIFTDLGIFVFCYSMFSIIFVLWDENNAELLSIP